MLAAVDRHGPRIEVEVGRAREEAVDRGPDPDVGWPLPGKSAGALKRGPGVSTRVGALGPDLVRVGLSAGLALLQPVRPPADTGQRLERWSSRPSSRGPRRSGRQTPAARAARPVRGQPRALSGLAVRGTCDRSFVANGRAGGRRSACCAGHIQGTGCYQPSFYEDVTDGQMAAIVGR